MGLDSQGRRDLDRDLDVRQEWRVLVTAGPSVSLSDLQPGGEAGGSPWEPGVHT